MYYACKKMTVGKVVHEIGDPIADAESLPTIAQMLEAGDVIWEDPEGRLAPHLRPKIGDKPRGYYAGRTLKIGGREVKINEPIKKEEIARLPNLAVLLRVGEIVWHDPDGRPSPHTLKHEPKTEGRRNARA